MDCFYAACERLREPALEGEPVVVGMGFEAGETTGAVATASYEARAHGVESAQAISSALERLGRHEAGLPDRETSNEKPRGYYRPVDMEFYESVSETVSAVLDDVADTVRAVGIDEAYLDVTERTGWDVVEGFARHVKQRIEADAGVTASIGVAANMSTAKVASDYEKPDGLVVVNPEHTEEFLSDLAIEELHGVGPVTARQLHELDIETAGELASAEERAVTDELGDNGRELMDRARGVDDRVVEPVGKPKSLSSESAFAEPTEDHAQLRDRLEALATALADRAQRKGALYQTIGIKVVTPPFDVQTRERSLSGPVDDPPLVESIAVELLEEFQGETVRKLGVRVSNLSFSEGDQTRLDGWECPSVASTRPGDGLRGLSSSQDDWQSRWRQPTLDEFL